MGLAKVIMVWGNGPSCKEAAPSLGLGELCPFLVTQFSWSLFSLSDEHSRG